MCSTSALAVWAYSHSSARWIFDDSLGDPTADDIWTLAKNRADGVTRTEVRDLWLVGLRSPGGGGRGAATRSG